MHGRYAMTDDGRPGLLACCTIRLGTCSSSITILCIRSSRPLPCFGSPLDQINLYHDDVVGSRTADLFRSALPRSRSIYFDFGLLPCKFAELLFSVTGPRHRSCIIVRAACRLQPSATSLPQCARGCPILTLSSPSLS